jgi:AcrR family transcriptional regulator
MGTGLRERRRLRAMRTIQERALDLFDERGFDAVTIEQIAAAAEVSPSSVYRWFGTKEGLIVADEFDGMGSDAIEELLDPADPVGSLLHAVLAYEAAPDGTARRRIRYFFAEPSVRTAALAALDRAGRRFAPVLAAHGALSEARAHVVANALAFGYFAALEQWYLDDGTRSIADHVEDGMAPLRRLCEAP